jgi:hypothetical protein
MRDLIHKIASMEVSIDELKKEVRESSQKRRESDLVSNSAFSTDTRIESFRTTSSLGRSDSVLVPESVHERRVVQATPPAGVHPHHGFAPATTSWSGSSPSSSRAPTEAPLRSVESMFARTFVKPFNNRNEVWGTFLISYLRFAMDYAISKIAANTGHVLTNSHIESMECRRFVNGMSSTWVAAIGCQLPEMSAETTKLIAEIYGSAGKKSETIRLDPETFDNLPKYPVGAQAMKELGKLVKGAQTKPSLIIWPLSNILPYINIPLVSMEKVDGKVTGRYVPSVSKGIKMFERPSGICATVTKLNVTKVKRIHTVTMRDNSITVMQAMAMIDAGP